MCSIPFSKITYILSFPLLPLRNSLDSAYTELHTSYTELTKWPIIYH